MRHFSAVLHLLIPSTLAHIAAFPGPTPPAKRQITDDGDGVLVGFYTVSNTWTWTACSSGSVFSTNGPFAACCTSTNPNCAMATGCKENVAVFPDGGSGVCHGNEQCDSLTIRLGPSDRAAKTMVQCISSGDLFAIANTLYRQTFTLSTPMTTVFTTATTTTTQSSIKTETEVPNRAVPSKGLLNMKHVLEVAVGAAAAAMAL